MEEKFGNRMTPILIIIMMSWLIDRVNFDIYGIINRSLRIKTYPITRMKFYKTISVPTALFFLELILVC